MSTPVIPSIDQLRELPLPPPPASYWPQTWGWLLLAAAALALACAWGLWRYLRWRRDRYRREALALHDELVQSLDDGGRRIAALRELPQLIKRVALSMPAGEAAARLGGDDWQAFLQRHSATPLPEDFAKRLALLAYAPEQQLRALDADELHTLLSVSRRWIEAHHVAV